MRYYIDPFGCAKNQVDAEYMMARLNNSGWSAAPDPADADIIIVNSCGFIESAKRESINAVLLWRRQYPNKKILLAGCLAQRYKKDLSVSLPEANGFFGVNDIDNIAEIAAALVSSPSVNNKSKEICSPGARPLLSGPGSAYIKISEGCNNNCAYCAIPLIRGQLRCRSVRDIVNECNNLLTRGVTELCIIGQDIGSYFSDGAGLPELLNAIAGLGGDFWVRLLYIHPDHFPLPILGLMEKDARFLPYFDVPFQHASPEILSAMNRKGSAEMYTGLVSAIRSRIPSAVIRTTFLVGFPGETQEDFDKLLSFQEKIRPDWLGCFAYSREEGTTAFKMKNQTPKKIALHRRREIENRQIPITEKNMDRFAGQKLNVLLEERFEGKPEETDNDSLWLGRLYCHAPDVDGAAVVSGVEGCSPGDVIPCRVIARRGFDLEVRPEKI